MLSVPMLLFGAGEYFVYGRKKGGYISVRLLSILLGMALTVTVFYTYSGIIGKHVPIVDILLFFVAAVVSFRYSYKMLQTDRFASKLSQGLAVFGVILLVVCIIIFTFEPPHIGLFRDPNSGAFGTAVP